MQFLQICNEQQDVLYQRCIAWGKNNLRDIFAEDEEYELPRTILEETLLAYHDSQISGIAGGHPLTPDELDQALESPEGIEKPASTISIPFDSVRVVVISDDKTEQANPPVTYPAAEAIEKANVSERTLEELNINRDGSARSGFQECGPFDPPAQDCA